MTTMYPGPNFEACIAELRTIQTHQVPDYDGEPGDMQTINAVPNGVFDQMYELLAAMQQLGPFPNPSVGPTLEGHIQLFWTTHALYVQIEPHGRVLVITCGIGSVSIREFTPNDDPQAVTTLARSIYEHFDSQGVKA